MTARASTGPVPEDTFAAQAPQTFVCHRTTASARPATRTWSTTHHLPYAGHPVLVEGAAAIKVTTRKTLVPRSRRSEQLPSVSGGNREDQHLPQTEELTILRGGPALYQNTELTNPSSALSGRTVLSPSHRSHRFADGPDPLEANRLYGADITVAFIRNEQRHGVFGCASNENFAISTFKTRFVTASSATSSVQRRAVEPGRITADRLLQFTRSPAWVPLFARVYGVPDGNPMSRSDYGLIDPLVRSSYSEEASAW